MFIRIAWLKIACSSLVLLLEKELRLNMLSWTKGVEVEPGVVIRGTAEHPVVVKKGSKVTEDIHS